MALEVRQCLYPQATKQLVMKCGESLSGLSSRAEESQTATFYLKILMLKFPQVPVKGWNIFRSEWVDCNYTLYRQVRREG